MKWNVKNLLIIITICKKMRILYNKLDLEDAARGTDSTSFQIIFKKSSSHFIVVFSKSAMNSNLDFTRYEFREAMLAAIGKDCFPMRCCCAFKIGGYIFGFFHFILDPFLLFYLINFNQFLDFIPDEKLKNIIFSLIAFRIVATFFFLCGIKKVSAF